MQLPATSGARGETIPPALFAARRKTANDCAIVASPDESGVESSDRRRNREIDAPCDSSESMPRKYIFHSRVTRILKADHRSKHNSPIFPWVALAEIKYTRRSDKSSGAFCRFVLDTGREQRTRVVLGFRFGSAPAEFSLLEIFIPREPAHVRPSFSLCFAHRGLSTGKHGSDLPARSAR